MVIFNSYVTNYQRVCQKSGLEEYNRDLGHFVYIYIYEYMEDDHLNEQKYRRFQHC